MADQATSTDAEAQQQLLSESTPIGSFFRWGVGLNFLPFTLDLLGGWAPIVGKSQVRKKGSMGLVYLPTFSLVDLYGKIVGKYIILGGSGSQDLSDTWLICP